MWAATAALMVAGYAATGGPLCYGVGRGWVARRSLDPYFAVFERTIGVPGDNFGADWFGEYVLWWAELGRRHAASD